jgi:cytochrome c oxidase assembly protein subunit 15
MAYAVFAALLWLAWRLHREQVAARRAVFALLGVALWQLASGLGNVVLGWPLVAALAHTAGAAVLATLLVVLVVRSALATVPERGDGRPSAGRNPAML